MKNRFFKFQNWNKPDLFFAPLNNASFKANFRFKFVLGKRRKTVDF
jgi:hypothetical protein